MERFYSYTELTELVEVDEFTCHMSPQQIKARSKEEIIF